jgi:hypothetical protein
MALSVTQQEPGAWLVIVLAVILIISVVIVVRSIRKERQFRKSVEEIESIWREAAHYDEQIRSAKKLL